MAVVLTLHAVVRRNLNSRSTYFRYSKRLKKVLRRLVPESHVRFCLSDSGSSKGAALVTAVAQRLASKRQQVRTPRGSEPRAFTMKRVFICVLTPEGVSPVLQLDETLSPFRLSLEQLMQVKARMRAGLEAGLKATGPSALKMLPAFVFRKPDGSGQMFIHSHESSAIFRCRKE